MTQYYELFSHRYLFSSLIKGANVRIDHIDKHDSIFIFHEIALYLQGEQLFDPIELEAQRIHKFESSKIHNNMSQSASMHAKTFDPEL
jgi:hypothetical protein